VEGILAEKRTDAHEGAGDATTLRARIDIDECNIADVAVGDRAFVVANAYPDRKFTLHVTAYVQGRKQAGVKVQDRG
jgi:hypothetical protein